MNCSKVVCVMLRLRLFRMPACLTLMTKTVCEAWTDTAIVQSSPVISTMRPWRSCRLLAYVESAACWRCCRISAFSNSSLFGCGQRTTLFRFTESIEQHGGCQCLCHRQRLKSAKSSAGSCKIWAFRVERSTIFQKRFESKRAVAWLVLIEPMVSWRCG